VRVCVCVFASEKERERGGEREREREEYAWPHFLHRIDFQTFIAFVTELKALRDSRCEQYPLISVPCCTLRNIFSINILLFSIMFRDIPSPPHHIKI